MGELSGPFILAVALLLSAAFTGWLRRFALSHSMLDIPNSRSSHVEPTPRGGGIAIVLVVLAALPVFAWMGAVSLPSFWAFFGAGLLVGGIGWLDDRRGIGVAWRLLVHFTAAAWAVAWISELPQLTVLGLHLDLGWSGGVLVVLQLVWLLNLYNFMDGIDGIAGVEALTVCLGALVLHGMAGVGDGAVRAVPSLLAAAVCGFLFWNFPRARIFMGDAGSGFVGFMLGLVAVEAGAIAGELFWGWMILLGGFIVDATVTVLRRLTRGERIYQAHRSHAYQRAARRLGSHVPVTLTFAALNLLWLLPMASLVVAGRIDALIGVAVAYAPLVWLALKGGAGLPDDEPDTGSRAHGSSTLVSS